VPTFPSFPSFDLSDFDLSQVDLPKFDLPKIDLAKFDLPKIDLANVDLPQVDTERVAGIARDAAYVGIGLGVLAVQQAQVRRREIRAAVERQIRQLVDAAS
jgi:hypothetical protein